MKTIEEQRKEFLDETIAFYSADTNRRATVVDKIGCFYRSPTGNKCAIGRYIPDDKYKTSFENLAFHFFIDTTNDETQKELWNALPEHIQALGVPFLANIQKLHDADKYWGINQLSEAGQVYVANIRNKFC